LDDDNDGFTDVEEQQATPPTDAVDARRFPVRLPPEGATTLVVDTASTLLAAERDGTPAAAYRSLSEALQALRTGRLPAVDTVQVRAGTYSPLTTQEMFPLELSGLAGLTLRGEGTVVLDAGLTAPVFQATSSRDLVIEGFVITRGVRCIDIQESTNLIIRHNHITACSPNGISVGTHASGIVIANNLVDDNDEHGVSVLGDSEATVRQNTLRRNGRLGLVITTTQATIIVNLVEENAWRGISIVANAIATVADNTVRQNGSNGINIFGATAELTGNTISNNAGAGVLVIRGVTATLMGNTIEHNFAMGIFSADPGTTLIATDNTVRLNQALGIFVLEGSTAIIRFSNNAEGDTIGNVIDIAS